jgi:hypothetical protein
MAFAARKAGVGHSDPIAGTARPTTSARSNCLRRAAIGVAEALMLAHGFSIELLVELVHAGLATASAERAVAGRHPIEVTRVRITEAGRRALD